MAKKYKPEKTEVEFSARRLKASLPADQASALGQRIGDLVSPLTEAGGLVGDYIRFFRQRATLKALERTHAFARERHFQLKGVPIKFLLSWAEAASLEDDTRLVNMWAELLLDASNDPERANLIFLNMLRMIPKAQAKTLESLWKKWQKSNYNPMLLEGFRWMLSMEVRGLITNVEERCGRLSSSRRREHLSRKLDEALTKLFESKGLQFRATEITFGDEAGGGGRCHTLDTGAGEFDAAAFRHLGIFEDDELVFDVKSKFIDQVIVRYLCPTPFGMHFLMACHGARTS